MSALLPTEYMYTKSRQEYIDDEELGEISVHSKIIIQTYKKDDEKYILIVLGDITEDSTNENETEVLEYIKDLGYHEVQEKIEIMIEKYMAWHFVYIIL